MKEVMEGEAMDPSIFVETVNSLILRFPIGNAFQQRAFVSNEYSDDQMIAVSLARKYIRSRPLVAPHTVDLCVSAFIDDRNWRQDLLLKVFNLEDKSEIGHVVMKPEPRVQNGVFSGVIRYKGSVPDIPALASIRARVELVTPEEIGVRVAS